MLEPSVLHCLFNQKVHHFCIIPWNASWNRIEKNLLTKKKYRRKEKSMCSPCYETPDETKIAECWLCTITLLRHHLYACRQNCLCDFRVIYGNYLAVLVLICLESRTWSKVVDGKYQLTSTIRSQLELFHTIWQEFYKHPILSSLQRPLLN